MNDFERFHEYWEQAVDALVYRVNCANSPVLTRAQIQEIWKDELVDKRFCSQEVKHSATVFLDELRLRRPDIAQQVAERLENSVMPMGVEPGEMAGKVGLAALLLGMGFTGSKKNPLLKYSSLVVGGAWAGVAYHSATKNTKSALSKAIEEEAERQILAYEELLRDEAGESDFAD